MNALSQWLPAKHNDWLVQVDIVTGPEESYGHLFEDLHLCS